MSVNQNIDKDLLKIAYDFLKLVTGELDKYTDEKGVIEINETDVTLFIVSHIQFARYGRAPGKRPPFQNILDFVKKKKIIFEGTSERGTAFAIQASIAKNGTKNYKKNAPNFIEEELKKNFEKMNRDSSELLKVSFQKYVDTTLKDFKLETKFKF